MYYVVQKFEHECFIEDFFEGNTLEKAIENAYNDKERDGIILGNDVIDSEMSLSDLIEWVKEDNYEVTNILQSETPITTMYL